MSYRIPASFETETVAVADGWAVNRTTAGVLIADPKLFPPSTPGANDGIKLVADYIHSKGLKFGIYTARGSRTCLGRPGSDGHEQLDADSECRHNRQQLLACFLPHVRETHERPGAETAPCPHAAWSKWGVDYLKEDSCGGHTTGTVWEQYSRMRDALNKTGREIYYSITQSVTFSDGPIREKMHCCE